MHKLSGQYVGKFHEQIVLNKHMGNFGNSRDPGSPGNAGNPGNLGNRGSRSYGFPDVSAEPFGN